MEKYIDLSYTIKDEMPVYPDDKEVKLYQSKFFKKDGYNYSILETGMHAGTHIDMPSHILENDISVDKMPVEKFVGHGCLLDVRDESIITLKKEYKNTVQENDIVLLYTGFDQNFYNKSYFTDHPVVDKTLAQFLVDRKIRMLGMDLPSPDKYPFDVHKILLQGNVLIMENMKNLGLLTEAKYFEIIAFPIKIKAEAALVRAVARLID